MVGADQRHQLGSFLRSRRERCRPEDVGLPPGGRRRTPGLRREEVATLAAVSVTWYTWLEQGRDVNPSRQVLTSLAEVLRLDRAEREHLFRLAGGLAPASGDKASAALPGQLAMLLDQLSPNPAFVTNRRFDVVGWNDAAAVLYPDLPNIALPQRNILWLTFLADGFRSTTEEWERDAAQVIAFFRAQAGERITEPEYAGLVEDLEAASTDFTRLWRREDVAAFASHERTLLHPKLGRVTLDYVKMRSFDGEHTVVAYLAPKGSELAGHLADLIVAPG